MGSVKGLDEPCDDDRCGYCSSKDNDSSYEDEEGHLPLSDKTFTARINAENDNTCSSFRKQANRTNRSHLGLASTGGFDSGGSEADLLRI